MESIGNYWFFWALYLGAGSLFTAIFWYLTRFERAIWSSYCLRATAIAIIFTPWYSNPQDNIMAPALMVATLDGITAGGGAAYRGFVPLILSLIFGLVIASVLAILKKKAGDNSLNNN